MIDTKELRALCAKYHDPDQGVSQDDLWQAFHALPELLDMAEWCSGQCETCKYQPGWSSQCNDCGMGDVDNYKPAWVKGE